MPNSFKPEIIEFSELSLNGVKVDTNHENASNDCPDLWRRFSELATGLEKTESYGISIMTEPNSSKFTYWAAVQGRLPGSGSVTLPGGTYARCDAQGLEQLGEVYNFLYSSPWLPEDSGLMVDFTKPCFEKYPADWSMTTTFQVYAPLAKKL